jgi:hypothetical protein
MNQEIEISVKHGMILIIVAIAMVPVFLLLSDGYDPRLGPLASLYYSMTIFHVDWFCREFSFKFGFGKPTECWNITIYTKYIVILCLIAASYGLLITKKLVRDPVLFLKEKFQELKNRSNTETTKEE